MTIIFLLLDFFLSPASQERLDPGVLTDCEIPCDPLAAEVAGSQELQLIHRRALWSIFSREVCQLRLSLRKCPFAVIAVFFSILASVAGHGAATFSEHACPQGTQEFLDWSLHFPLKVGNEWVYSDGEDPFMVQVLRDTREANGRKYFEVAGYFPGGLVKVRIHRQGSLGEILEYNPEGRDFL